MLQKYAHNTECTLRKQTVYMDETFVETNFSNSLIIHAALTQPEHLILVRWMSLETQWKTSWKHGRVWNPCLKLFQTRLQILLICILIIKQQKHEAINNSDLITHFTKQTFKPKLFTANVECNGTVLKLPKTEKPISFLTF